MLIWDLEWTENESNETKQKGNVQPVALIEPNYHKCDYLVIEFMKTIRLIWYNANISPMIISKFVDIHPSW